MTRSTLTCCAVLLLLGCGSAPDDTNPFATEGSGGAVAAAVTGGAQPPPAGGGPSGGAPGGAGDEAPPTGGVAAGTGGADVTGGAAPETGGVPATGGTGATGGALPTGGLEESGGSGGGETEERCESMTMRCVDGDVYACVIEDLNFWALWSVCPNGCADGACIPPPPDECELGAIRCNDGHSEFCSFADHGGTVWVLSATCDAEFGCHDGYCNECVPNSWWCSSAATVTGCVEGDLGYELQHVSCSPGYCEPVVIPGYPDQTGACDR